MNIKSEGLLKLVEENFKGSRTQCAKALEVAPSTVCRIINGEYTAGIKLVTKVIQYCKSNGMDSNEVIFFD